MLQAELLALPAGTQEAIKRFHRSLEVAHRSVATQRMYVRCVVRWLVFGGAPGHVDAELLARFLGGRRRTCAAATVNMDIKALRAFYRVQASWDALADGHLLRLPAQRKLPARLPRWFSDDQVGEILAACPDTFIGRRDRAILLTLYATGMRAGELASMQISHFIDDDLLYIEGKGRKVRYVPVGPVLAAALVAYRKDRATTRPGKGGAFWVCSDGRGLRNGRSIWEIVSKRIWLALGLRSGLHRVNRGGRPWTGHFPHELRSSCATALLRNGMALPAIADLLGHADVATTALYAAVDLEQLKLAARHHPRAFRAEGTSGSADSAPMKTANVARLKSEQDPTPTARKRSR